MITMHHHIESTNGLICQLFHYQSARSFKCQMAALQKKYVSTQEASSLKITLDDGLKSQLTGASILDELKLKGYFYYNSSTLTSGKVLNVHLVHILLKKLNIEKKKMLYADLIDSVDFSINLQDAKHIYRRQRGFSVDQKIKFLVNYVLVNSEIDNILEYYYRGSSDVSLNVLNENIYMNRDELRDLQIKGHHIFPHGHTHKILGKMSDKELEIEFSDMSDAHETMFKTQFEEFCVPYGSVYSWNQKCDKIAKSYGIRKIILLDNAKDILPNPDQELHYFSREDCCLLDDYEYV
jgi:hypothetical protein